MSNSPADGAAKLRVPSRWHMAVAFVLAGIVVAAVVRLATSVEPDDAVQRSAKSFVGLALRLAAMPGHEHELDSYFGADDLKPAADDIDTLDALSARVDELLARVEREQRAAPSPRGAQLAARVTHFAALLALIAQPGRWSFEEEARRVYGAAMPEIDIARTRDALARLDAALPGDGEVSQRLARFRSRFVVPGHRRKAVFERALQECRARTRAHWTLPPAERVELVWTREVSAAWHRYRGAGVSTLQVNPGAVATVGSAIDIACHEAYPGHHAQFLLMDQRAGAGGLPVEDRIVLLRSPASMLREGAANYGVELAFPLADRVAFDREVLFPMAGLDPAQAEHYERVHRLVDTLSAAAAPILRDYRDGAITRTEALLKLDGEAQIGSPAALLQFADQFGSYVLGYTVVRERVRDYVDMRVAKTGQDAWAVLRELLSGPDVSVLSAAGG